MLHRFSLVMTRADRDCLYGDLEVDKTLVEGVEYGGKRGRDMKKSIVVIALEIKEPKNFGSLTIREVDA